jgi:hypothetical protein
MSRVLAGTAIAVLAGLVSGGTPADANPKPQLAALEGATVVATYTAPTGFIDDPVTGDATRLAYVVSDASTSSQLHVVTLADGSDVTVELAPVTTHPVALELVGQRVFVVGALDDGGQIAALVELQDNGKARPAGTVVYKLGPAQSIVPITRDGKRRVVVHRATALKTGGTHHEVDVVSIETGQRVAAARPLEVDGNGFNAALDFHVNHWSDGMTRAYGIKGGEWNKKDDARSPDVEAVYDLLTGKFDTHVIGDLFEQRKRYQVLADAAAGLDFVHMSWDLQTVQVWSGGKPHDAQLDQPVINYDPKSLQGVVDADGAAWIALKVDPVNVEAVARKKADPEYLDIFRATPDGKATRKMRVLSTNTRHRFGVLGDKVWLIERNNGFERGGKSLTLYTVK